MLTRLSAVEVCADVTKPTANALTYVRPYTTATVLTRLAQRISGCYGNNIEKIDIVVIVAVSRDDCCVVPESM